MSNVDIKFGDLDSQDVFAWFEKIVKIPHGSKNEKGLSDYLLNYARENGFEVQQDALWNLVIRKGASSTELARKPPVILQSHMDMVLNPPEKFVDSSAINLILEDGWLRSDGTTLGADNGIGIAYSMALLDSTDIVHPPLEIVFTTQEEVGMDGASAFDIGWLQGRTLINMDSEEEGVFCTNCCSGTTITLSLPTKKLALSSIYNANNAKNTVDEYEFFSIEVSGLQGGHSGIEIDKERGNSNRLLGRILVDMAAHYTYHIASIEGGIARNVIAFSTKAIVCVRKDDADKIFACVNAWEDVFSNELSYNVRKGENHCQVKAKMLPTKVETDMVFSQDSFEKLLITMNLMPHGVSTADRINNMPETSNNFATIEMQDNAIVLTASIRSSLMSKRDFIESQIRSIATIVGAKVTTTGVYPAWEYAADSPIREIFQKAYENTYGSGKMAKLEGIHAGLECGIFFAKFAEKGKKLDMFAFGPTILGAHTPTERVNISSVNQTWKLLKEALKILTA